MGTLMRMGSLMFLRRISPLANPTRLPSQTRKGVCPSQKLTAWCKRPKSIALKMKQTSKRSKLRTVWKIIVSRCVIHSRKRSSRKFEGDDKDKIEKAVQE